MPDPSPRLCWVVTDGRRGIENQALGLAEAVGRLIPLAIERRVAPKPPLVWRAPVKLADLGPAESRPDLWIGCGRASLPYSERARTWFEGRALVVQVQDPKRPIENFDLIVPPFHDGVLGPNVFPILGSPNRIDLTRLADRRAAFEAAPDAPPHPRATVLVGGDSRRHRFTPAVLDSLLAALAHARASGWSLLVTTSRRTPDFAVRALRGHLSAADGVRLWTDETDGPNPYDAFLAAADVVLVTKDSTNMITEAASAGKPVLLLPMEGEDGKFAALYEALERRGYAKPYDGALEAGAVEPLRETERAAAEIVRRLAERKGDRS